MRFSLHPVSHPCSSHNEGPGIPRLHTLQIQGSPEAEISHSPSSIHGIN